MLEICEIYSIKYKKIRVLAHSAFARRSFRWRHNMFYLVAQSSLSNNTTHSQ